MRGDSMFIWFRILWITIILFNSIALIWYILGSTANFQRSLDLVERISLIVYGLPSLALTSLSILILVKRKRTFTVPIYALGFILILIMIYLSQPLFQTVRTEGWLYEHVQRDPVRVTTDGRYKYHIELVNMYQRNRSERLIVTNMLTGEAKTIQIDLDTRNANGVSRGRGDWGWAIMEPTDSPNQYKLVTTEYLKMPEKVFLIDVEKHVSEKLE